MSNLIEDARRLAGKTAGAARQIAQAMLVVAVAALTWFLLLSFAGLAMIVAGVYIMLGIGPALCFAGFGCLLLAAFLRRGLSNA